MQFLTLRGHTRLIPQGGLAEFPDAILNAKRLDLFNLYREVFLCREMLTENLPRCSIESFGPSGGLTRRLSCWEWHQLERTGFLKDA